LFGRREPAGGKAAISGAAPIFLPEAGPETAGVAIPARLLIFQRLGAPAGGQFGLTRPRRLKHHPAPEARRLSRFGDWQRRGSDVSRALLNIHASLSL
jgi:hypothetical protein